MVQWWQGGKAQRGQVINIGKCGKENGKVEKKGGKGKWWQGQGRNLGNGKIGSGRDQIINVAWVKKGSNGTNWGQIADMWEKEQFGQYRN